MAGRNRGTSPYQDDDYDDDDYSDDFDDDDADTGNRRYKTRSPLQRTDRSNRSRGRGRGRLTGRSSQEPKFDNVAKRVMSARRLKINELINQNRELQLQLQDLKEENKLVKKTQLMQDRALKKFEDRESDLPMLIQRQNNEVRSLKDQIRKWREKYEKTDRYLRDAEDELEKVKIKLKKLKSLADEKDLPERAELNKKINKAELDLEEKDVKIRELEKHIQHLEKNHRHELGIERARQKDISKQMQQLRDENDKLSTNVKEKEKEIQIKNIYANRMVKPPHRLPNSYNGTPHGTPPPQRKRRQSLSEADGITPRERAKQMEQKRREEMRRQRELKQQRQAPTKNNYLKVESSPRQAQTRKLPIMRGGGHDPNYHDEPDTEQHEKVKREQELRSMREREEREREDRERRDREERERKEWEEKERRMNEQAQLEEEERKNREERERMKREAEERHRRDKERKEREERERREKREREERERRERERLEQERRAAEERRRFEDDVTLQAERKKKDEILQKLREIDEGGQKSKEKKESFFVTQDKEGSEDSMSSKKSYKFTKPTENLHKGRPSHSDKSRQRDIDGLETGGYNPTFGSGGAGKSSTKKLSLFDDDEPSFSSKPQAKPAQKSKLMEELFGPKADSGPKQNDLFSNPKPPPKRSNQTNSKSGFPWDDDSSRKKSLDTKRENSSTLFGGGSALINDEDFSLSTKKSTTSSLPRRQKQTTTAFHTRPTVNAVDAFDDDIEEVIL